MFVSNAARVRVLILVFVSTLILVPVATASAFFLTGHLSPVNPGVIAGFWATVLSLFASYFPGFNTWYAKLRKEVKKLLMLAGLAVITAAMFVAGCFPVLGVAFVECDNTGAIRLFEIFIMALIANRVVYKYTPQMNKVKAARAKNKVDKRVDKRRSV